MGSPVSVVVPEILIQNIEERALITTNDTRLWLRYVEDTFTAVYKDEIGAYYMYDHLNEQNADIQLTREVQLKKMEN